MTRWPSARKLQSHARKLQMPDDTLGCCKVMLGSCKDDGGMGGNGNASRLYKPIRIFQHFFAGLSATL